MEIRHNNYADCFINRGWESSVDQWADKLIQLNYSTDLPFASQPAVQIYAVQIKQQFYGENANGSPPNISHPKCFTITLWQKSLHTSGAHNTKIAKSTHPPQTLPTFGLIGWCQTIWLLDWLPYPLDIYSDLKRQCSHSRRISMRFKCLRSVWDVCCGTIITHNNNKNRT